MKKLFFSFLFSISIAHCFSQDVVNVVSGTTVGISTGTIVGLQGSITLQNGTTLTNNGSFYIQKYSSLATANFVSLNATPYRMGTGIFIFQGTAGTGIQQLQCADTIQRIEINNDSLRILSNVVADKWYLIRGKVNTDENYAIASSTASLAVEADGTNTNFANSWFNGRLRRYILPVSINNYVFPVGNSSSVKRLEMDNMAAQPLTGISYIDAAFRNKKGDDLGLNVTENSSNYTSINNTGVWHLTPNALPTGGKYSIKLYFNGFTGLSDNLFGVLRRVDSSSNAADWIVPVASTMNGFNGTGRKLSDGYALRNNVSTFSQYGIGLVNTVFPLVMGDFSAKRISKNTVQLDWNTLLEQDVKGFAVERRLDNENSYSLLSFINSKANNGNSTQPLNYLFVDNNGYKQLSYYRLILSDKNNTEKYSAVKAVKGFGDKNIMVSAYPIPAKDNITIEARGLTTEKLNGYLTDVSGRIVLRFTIANGINNMNVQNLVTGNYVLVCVNAFGDGQNFSEKITIVK